MHYFYSEIRSRRINVLEPFMRYAKSSYDKHMEAYAKAMVRRPFGKLLVCIYLLMFGLIFTFTVYFINFVFMIQEFFEGIESLLRTNAAPEEVGFRIQFNKTALKKVISQYPGKEVKKISKNIHCISNNN